MSNIKLVKHDGEVLIVPAGSISAIGCVKGEEVKNAEEAVSMIYSSFRNGTTYFLAEPVEAVLAKVKKADPDLNPEDPWVVFGAYQPGEVQAIKRSILLSYEGMKDGGYGRGEEVEGEEGVSPGEPYTRVYIQRPGSNQDSAYFSADATPETLAILDEVLFPKKGKTKRPVTPVRRAKPKGRK